MYTDTASASAVCVLIIAFPLQFIAKTKGAVSATCCYTQRLLSWQVAEAGQKNKIELQWDDITSLKVTPMVSTNLFRMPSLTKSCLH